MPECWLCGAAACDCESDVPATPPVKTSTLPQNNTPPHDHFRDFTSAELVVAAEAFLPPKTEVPSVVQLKEQMVMQLIAKGSPIVLQKLKDAVLVLAAGSGTAESVRRRLHVGLQNEPAAHEPIFTFGSGPQLSPCNLSFLFDANRAMDELAAHETVEHNPSFPNAASQGSLLGLFESDTSSGHCCTTPHSDVGGGLFGAFELANSDRLFDGAAGGGGLFGGNAGDSSARYAEQLSPPSSPFLSAHLNHTDSGEEDNGEEDSGDEDSGEDQLSLDAWLDDEDEYESSEVESDESLSDGGDTEEPMMHLDEMYTEASESDQLPSPTTMHR